MRWYAWAEIQMVIAEAGMTRLGEFISTCEEYDYGDATRQSLRDIYDNKLAPLRLELAAMLDMRTLVATTYELEVAVTPHPTQPCPNPNPIHLTLL